MGHDRTPGRADRPGPILPSPDAGAEARQPSTLTWPELCTMAGPWMQESVRSIRDDYRRPAEAVHALTLHLDRARPVRGPQPDRELLYFRDLLRGRDGAHPSTRLDPPRPRRRMGRTWLL